MKMNKTGTHCITTLLLLPWLIAGGCDETFVPWEENEQYHFSIYGYLDASADTQWVRVMPVREELFLDQKPLDAIVTLEHVESGDSVVMNDSLFSYFHGRYAWNFWTTMDLQPEQTYRITAVRPDGNFSFAEATLPKDFPVPLVGRVFPGFSSTDQIFLEDVERLADVRVILYIRLLITGDEYMVPFAHLKDTLRQASGDFVLAINSSEGESKVSSLLGDTPRTTFHKQIFIASAGPDYLHFPLINDNVAALPDGISNVTNGLGYLAGIVSKTVPFKICLEEETGDHVPCELEPYPWSVNLPIWNIN